MVSRVRQIILLILGASLTCTAITVAEHDHKLPGSSVFLSRQRRTPTFPKGTSMAVKWSLSFPFRTVSKLSGPLQITHLIKVPLARLYRQDILVKKDQLRRRNLLESISEGETNSGFSNRFGGFSSHDLSRVNNSLQNPMDYFLDEETDFSENSDILSKSTPSQFKFSEHFSLDRLQAREDRLIFFKDFHSLIQKMGFPPEPCLQRIICEIGEHPIDDSLLGGLFTLIMMPSLGGRSEYTHEDSKYNTYVDAELYGREVGNCGSKFKECPTSLFWVAYNLLYDLFS